MLNRLKLWIERRFYTKDKSRVRQRTLKEIVKS